VRFVALGRKNTRSNAHPLPHDPVIANAATNLLLQYTQIILTVALGGFVWAGQTEDGKRF
jgi:hypothetical protein